MPSYHGGFSVSWAVIPRRSEILTCSLCRDTVSSYFLVTFKCSSLHFQVTLTITVAEDFAWKSALDDATETTMAPSFHCALV